MQQGIDTKLFANARGMTATQAFDVVPDDNRDNRRCYWSTIPRPYQNGPCRDECELPARPQHLVPHGEIKRRPIEAGIVPTDEEHQQRRKRLGFVGKWWLSRIRSTRTIISLHWQMPVRTFAAAPVHRSCQTNRQRWPYRIQSSISVGYAARRNRTLESTPNCTRASA
jgi:hypothetical protein